MSKRTGDENVSPGTQKKRACIKAGSEGSSADADSGRLFPDTESENSSTEATFDNPSEDTDNMATPDRLTRAPPIMEKLGPWEVEYSYEGEAGLQKHYSNCQKNPGHKNFIPVYEFSIEHLPEGYRDKDMVDYIRAVSDLTVRVTVKDVSDRRPATTGISGKPNPNYNDRDKRNMRVGTGWVQYVTVYNDDRAYTCQCKDCKNSSTPRTTFGRIYIKTAAHVVFDAKEGDHTTCHLFYDKGGLPETCSGAIELSGMHCMRSNPVSDACYLSHCTHDVGLAQRLARIYKERDKLINKIRSETRLTWKYKRTRPSPDKQPLLFMVSHPHGYSKQISIGRWTSQVVFNNVTKSCMYSTATCPGSSGAMAYLPRGFDTLYTSEDLFWRCIHCGASERQPGLNFCHVIEFNRIFEWVSLDFMLHNEELRENNFICVEEEDLRKHYVTCQKNPDHQNFFPVDKFCSGNLPLFYRTDKVMKFIKTVADLTVRVSVRYVSKERPETVSGTDIPYPWDRNRGSNQLRVGSGMLTEVELFPDKACRCKECKNSDTPTIGYAHVHIQTAAHLVYDTQEAEQTTCHLFFNSGETLAACKDAVPLTSMWCRIRFLYNEICELIYITNDLDLAGRLQPLTEVFNKYVHRINYEHVKNERFFNSVDTEQTGRNKSALEPPLYIVVSHPHGCAKQVSLAHCGCHGNSDTQEHQCPYNLMSCSGSSGARVISLGWENLYPSYE